MFLVVSEGDKNIANRLLYFISYFIGPINLLELEYPKVEKSYSVLELHSDKRQRFIWTPNLIRIPTAAELLGSLFRRSSNGASFTKRVHSSDALLVPRFSKGPLALSYYLYAILLRKDILVCLTEDQAFWIAAQRRLPFFWEIIHGLHPLTLILMTIVNRSIFIVPTYSAKVELVRSALSADSIYVISTVVSRSGKEKLGRIIQNMTWPFPYR
ncbi:MAG: hypothetical protein UZ21_OP11001001167 [Microgenomates bacterium OLB22]|nr:MAG: hypothetical protein UZ21_OP11001001167 [Microgenomates bacterium OLB22]